MSECVIEVALLKERLKGTQRKMFLNDLCEIPTIFTQMQLMVDTKRKIKFYLNKFSYFSIHLPYFVSLLFKRGKGNSKKNCLKRKKIHLIWLFLCTWKAKLFNLFYIIWCFWEKRFFWGGFFPFANLLMETLLGMWLMELCYLDFTL